MLKAQLAEVSADVSYHYEEEEKVLHVTIEDFEGFDEDWSEVERELTDATKVDAFIEWLEETADKVEPDFYTEYHFGDVCVVLGYASYDI